MRMLRAVALALAALPAPAPAQGLDEVAFVMDLFADLQPVSFDKEIEVCGFVGLDAQGALVATQATAGFRASCGSDWPTDMTVLASYHTHGAFDVGYHNELPSETDMLSDQALGINGWIATPGGWLWYVDSARMVTKQVCGVSCLPVAPGFYKSQAGDIAKGYTHADLVRRLGL